MRRIFLCLIIAWAGTAAADDWPTPDPRADLRIAVVDGRIPSYTGFGTNFEAIDAQLRGSVFPGVGLDVDNFDLTEANDQGIYVGKANLAGYDLYITHLSALEATPGEEYCTLTGELDQATTNCAVRLFKRFVGQTDKTGQQAAVVLFSRTPWMCDRRNLKRFRAKLAAHDDLHPLQGNLSLISLAAPLAGDFGDHLTQEILANLVSHVQCPAANAFTRISENTGGGACVVDVDDPQPLQRACLYAPPDKAPAN